MSGPLCTNCGRRRRGARTHTRDRAGHRQRPLRRILSTALLLPVLLATDSDPRGTEVIVAFTHARFDPATVEVRRGARVTFHNVDADGGTYSIVAADGSFESVPLGPDGEWTHRFASGGEHEYFVKEQPETRGRAIVR